MTYAPQEPLPLTYDGEPRIGSLFSGYCGLDLGVKAVVGGRTVWVADVCKVNKDGTVGHHEPHRAPCSILAHRVPDATNLGDVSKVDWLTVGAIDVLTLGFPCQDVSTAGKQAGLRPGTRSGLWSHAAYAISQLRPRLVVIENVRGLLSASAHSDLEPCPWCLGDDPTGHLRALGAVLGDLAELGYDAAWIGVPASDVGAPHGRFRVFILAWPADAEGFPWGLFNRDRGAATDPRGEHGEQRRLTAPSEASGRRALSEPAGRDRAPVGPLLPTPKTIDTSHIHTSQRAKDLYSSGPTIADVIDLLPTPMAQDGQQPTVAPSRHGRHSYELSGLPALLPTPLARDYKNVGAASRVADRMAERSQPLTEVVVNAWGDYAPAITRWSSATRSAPAPTELSQKGSPRLSARFSEWMMGLPDGWITDTPGITRSEALKAAGNGVVPQQATYAIRRLVERLRGHV